MSADEHPQSSEFCVICDGPARPSSPSRNPRLPPLCGKRSCGDAWVARYDAALERRLQEERAALKANARARREAALEIPREEDRERLRALLGAAADPTGAPLLALSDGTTSGTGVTALVPLAGGTTALARVSAVPSVAEERRRRRQVWEAAWKSLAALRERIDPRRAAIEKERAPLDQQRLEYIRLRQAVARAHEPRFVEGRGVIEESDITAEEQATLDAAGDKLKPVWARLKVLREEYERLEAEERAASEATAKAREDYHRWLEIECEMRRRTLEAPRRVCERDGIDLLDDTRRFCSDECERRYESLNFVWFPQCEGCHRYFAADAAGGTGVIPRLDGTTYCSWLCVATSPEDLDEWPAADAPCWGEVRYMPHPPLTAHERAAFVRRRLLRQFGGRRPPGRPSVVSEVHSPARSPAEGVDPSAPLMIAPRNSVADLSRAETRVLEVLRAAAGELTRAALLAAVRLRAGDVVTAVNRLITLGLVLREGSGRCGDPFRFRAVGSL